MESQPRPRRSAVAILIDPDATSGAAHGRRLQESGYSVVIVADGTAATAAAAKTPPSVIFYASVAAGRIDASELMLALKANDATRHVPIQMLTSSPEPRNQKGLNVVTRTGW